MYILSHSLFFCVIYSEDVTEVYPLSRIEQEVREQKDMFGSLDLHETYYKVCTVYTICFVCVCVRVCVNGYSTLYHKVT